MNIDVALNRLRKAVSERPSAAYVLTTSDDGYPHSVYLPVEWERDGIIAEVGARTASNATARPRVSVLYPVRSENDYSLIVDGTAVIEPAAGVNRLRVTPTRAVFHRPGPPADPTSSCTADCVRILAMLPAPQPAR
jgi:Pyridoxamine 5'-phosphate oxidase